MSGCDPVRTRSQKIDVSEFALDGSPLAEAKIRIKRRFDVSQSAPDYSGRKEYWDSVRWTEAKKDRNGLATLVDIRTSLDFNKKAEPDQERNMEGQEYTVLISLPDNRSDEIHLEIRSGLEAEGKHARLKILRVDKPVYMPTD